MATKLVFNPITGNLDMVQDSPLRSEWLQNGFPNRTDSSMSFTDGTRAFAIAPAGTSFDYYIAGVKYTVTSSDSVVISDTEGPWYIYYDGSTLTATVSPNHVAVRDIMENKAWAATVFWDADNSKGQLLEERHGFSMSPITHVYLHETVGTRYDIGLALNTINADQNGSADSHAQFGIDAGQIFDEDIEHNLNAVGSTTGLQIWHMDTSGWTFTTSAGFSMLTTGTGRLAYDNSGTLTEVTNGNFVLCHIFGTNFIHNNPVVAIGQAEYSTKKAAQEGALSEILGILSIANISPELKPLASVIFQTKNTFSNAVKAIIVSTESGDDYVDFRTDALNPASASAPDHANLINLNWLAAGHNIDTDLNFNQFKAIAMVCDNGATLPSTPTKGQWFLHTPTGRNILCMYDGSTWICMLSLGSMTVFVDKTAGTDSQDKGTGVDADAFETIQFAIDQIPGLVRGNVLININNETYTESVVIQGKTYIGDFYIRLKGTVTTDLSEVTNADIFGLSAIGDTSLNMTINAFQKKRVRITGGTGSGQVAIISSNTSDTITIQGIWERSGSYTDINIGSGLRNGIGMNPDATSDFVVETWATKISGLFRIVNGQKAVILDTLELTNTSGNMFQVTQHSIAELYGCEFSDDAGNSSVKADNYAVLFYLGSYYHGGTVGANIEASFVRISNLLEEGGSIGCLIKTIATADIRGSLFDNNSGDGLQIIRASYVSMDANDNTFSNNGAWGIDMDLNSAGRNISTQNYSGNTSGTHRQTTGAQIT